MIYIYGIGLHLRFVLFENPIDDISTVKKEIYTDVLTVTNSFCLVKK